MSPEWISLFWQVVWTLIDHGLLSKDKLPKDFPKTTKELEEFILKISIKNADKIFNEVVEVVDEWED